MPDQQWVFVNSLSQKQSLQIICRKQLRLSNSGWNLLFLFCLGTAGSLGWSYRPSEKPQILTMTEIVLSPAIGVLFTGFMVFCNEFTLRQNAKRLCIALQGSRVTVTNTSIGFEKDSTKAEIDWNEYSSFEKNEDLIILKAGKGVEAVYLFEEHLQPESSWEELVLFLREKLMAKHAVGSAPVEDYSINQIAEQQGLSHDPVGFKAEAEEPARWVFDGVCPVEDAWAQYRIILFSNPIMRDILLLGPLGGAIAGFLLISVLYNSLVMPTVIIGGLAFLWSGYLLLSYRAWKQAIIDNRELLDSTRIEVTNSQIRSIYSSNIVRYNWEGFRKILQGQGLIVLPLVSGDQYVCLSRRCMKHSSQWPELLHFLKTRVSTNRTSDVS
ncbi:hypothetical protein [Planctopirus hydrillae]|uniref:YcxB-like protein domain-containing protein n=1 Tax=Planctopirus hydrillae TaxID=1841610 RepID=A0A1C3EUA4_9PLAN|nr:hypothetical protein [Planctopirus hydrillae]ODA36830.1 hypothetical protein A6X21_01795 [Planctopirus hydrillae]